MRLDVGRPAEVNETGWFWQPCEIEGPASALEVRMPFLVRRSWNPSDALQLSFLEGGPQWLVQGSD